MPALVYYFELSTVFFGEVGYLNRSNPFDPDSDNIIQVPWSTNERYALAQTLIPTLRSRSDTIKSEKELIKGTTPLYNGYSQFCSGFSDSDLGSPSELKDKSTDYYRESVGNFTARKRAGEIVVNNYRNGNVTVVAKPGIYDLNYRGFKFRGYIPFGAIPHPSFVRRGKKGRWYCSLPGQDRIFMRDSDSVLVGDVHQKAVERASAVIPISAERMLKHVLSQRALDSGLVTSTLASANEEELDILTTMAEMPDSIKTLCQAGRSVAKWSRELKKGEVTLSRDYAKQRAKIEANFQSQVAKINKSRLGATKHQANLLDQRKKKLETAKKKAFVQEAKNFGDATANLYMWARYDLLPNIYTVEDIISAHSAMLSAYSTSRDKDSQTLPGLDIPGWTVQSQATTLNRCFIKRRYEVGSDLTRSWQSVVSKNLLTTAWNLGTRTFVVDWFINIGDLISAVFGANNSLEQGSTYSWKEGGKINYSDSKKRTTIYTIDTYRRDVIQPLNEVGLSTGSGLNLLRSLDAAAMLWPSVKRQLSKSKTFRG